MRPDERGRSDRADKVHFLRKAEGLWDLPSTIVYCDLSGAVDCKVSATTVYPNGECDERLRCADEPGITRGPENTLWQGALVMSLATLISTASSTGGEANHWEWDAEYNLHLLDSVKLCVIVLAALTDRRQPARHGQHQRGRAGRRLCVRSRCNRTDACRLSDLWRVRWQCHRSS